MKNRSVQQFVLLIAAFLMKCIGKRLMSFLQKKKNCTFKYLRPMAYQAGDISCFGEGIEKYFRLFSKLKLPGLLKKLLFILPGLFLFFLLQASCKRKNKNEEKKSPE